MEDLPKTWDAYYDFFKGVQTKLRAQGERKVYGIGFQLNTTGNDSNLLFDYFLIAYGGQGIVCKDARLPLDDPQVRAGGIKALTYPTTAHKEGRVTPTALNRNDGNTNPAYAQVQNEHVWPTGWSDIMTGGMTPQAAAEKALKRAEEIFAKYPITQG